MAPKSALKPVCDRSSVLLLAGTAAAACLGAWVLLHALWPSARIPVPFTMRGQWIASANPDSSVTQFRKRFVLGGATRNAWLAVSADEGFEVIVNGVSLGRSVVWRSTHPFQAGLSERGQTAGAPEPAIDLNFPREYQWRGQRTYLVPVFFDLAPYLLRGSNSLAIEVESRERLAVVAFEGEVLLWSGERVRLDSDTTFKGSIRPAPDGRAWTAADYPDLDWPAALTVPALPGALRTILNPGVFRDPFAGRWLRAPLPLDAATWYEVRWHLDRPPEDAWVRVLSDRPYQVFVNDLPVRVADPRVEARDSGPWGIGVPRWLDKAAVPEMLDDDAVGTLFAGARFDMPSEVAVLTAPEGPLGEADPLPPGENDVVPPRDIPDRADPLRGMPDLTPPKALQRLARSAVFNGYGVGRLLHEGDNVITVRVAAVETGSEPAPWPPRLAVDGAATFPDGSANRLADGGSWTARSQRPDGAVSASVPAAFGGAAAMPDVGLPPLEYRGDVGPPGALPKRVAFAAVLAALAIAVLAMVAGLLAKRIGPTAAPPEDPHTAPGVSQPSTRVVKTTWFLMLVLPSTGLFALFLVYFSWCERDDLLVLLPEGVWRSFALGAFLAAAAIAVLRSVLPAPVFAPHRALRVLFHGPSRRLLLLLVLLACALARAHGVEAQPFDDDENPTVQAAYAIARTGLPRFTPDVFYTRSPAYHYLVGAAVRLFGENMWALRLPSVFFATATALLIAIAGEHLLKSRWTGLIAAALYAIHPYAIFVGHMARFYQQQQFFCLLTIYFFCRGFVDDPSRSRWRFLALGSFLLAVLSQEISLVMGPPLALSYAVFPRRYDRRFNWEFVTAGFCALALIATDLAVFLTACTTTGEAISPNIEPTLALHFANPLHLLTMFVAYSRLHLALSILLALGTPLLLAKKSANVYALFLILVAGIVTTNLLVTLEAFRYLFWVLPVWLLLSVHATRALVLAASPADGRGPVARQWLAPVLAAILFGAVVLSWSPWKVVDSYATTIEPDSASALTYVRGELRDGDAVAATEPNPPATLLEVGKVDYDISVPLLNDFVYRKDGKLIDRNAGAEVISTLEQLQDAIARHDRLWVIIDRNKFRSRGQDILWQYPAGRFEAFLRENLELEHQSFQYSVFLWDSRSGRYRSFRQHGAPFL